MATEVIIIDRDRIQKAFDEFETQKSLLTNCTQQWENLSSHFTSLEQSLLEKTQTLDTKLETLDLETKKALAKISERENSISERESIAIKLIEEQKEIALKEIEKGGDCNGFELEEALKSHCRKMDSKGLLKYMISKRKESLTLRVKIVVAIRECVDPYRLVLDGIEEFLEAKEGKGGVSDKRWACGNLIQGLFPDLDGKSVLSAVATSVKERAGVLAEAWKGKMESVEGGDDMGPAEAAMFLQMVIGFGLKDKFGEEFLKKLLLSYPSRREMPKLAAALGFGEKMGDVIEELVKKGKEIEAVEFTCECGLTERFPPVPALRAYLRNSRKNANTMLKNGNYSAAQSEAANALELNSLKAIIRCVQEQKLGAEFNLDSLIKRVSQLEKARVEKKKSIPVGNKPQTKRSRGGSGGGGGGGSGPPHFRPAKSGRSSNTYPSFSRRNPVPPVPMYSYPHQPMYDPSPPYGGSYGGGHSRSPAAAVPQTYAYQPEDMAGAGTARSSVAPYTPQPPMYGGYDYSGAAAPGTYQPSFPQ
ncbi:hypothetical protein MKW94_026891 [Papaver nudicaule]|uniref:FRIGIDA-like protein n=1 Tax=Papaver nudicaule TaxID=74823 RepID=A0AA41S920_PAPNU|nr:hypothetical protein [Papaver nudicaule]